MDDVIKKYKEVLNKNIKYDTLSHSYLINTNYFDKLELAATFIKTIIEKKYINISYEDLIKEGYIIILGEDNKNIKVSDIENLQGKFSKKSIGEKPYFYVINNAEILSSSVYNKLLKFLEEPVEEIYAIIMTSNKRNVSKTIVSRCQTLSFNVKNNEFLNQNNEDIDFLIEFVKNLEYRKKEQIAYLGKDFYNRFEDRKVLYKFINDLLYVYDDILHNLLLNKVEYFSQYKEIIKELTKINTVKSINDKINIISDMIDLLKYNPNIKLYFDKLIIRMSGVEDNG